MRGTAWAAGAAAAAVALAAGCGTVPYQAGSGHGQGASGRGQGGTTAATTPGPPTITRQQAERLAQDLLSRAPLPAGARQRSGPPVRALDWSPSAESGSPSAALHKVWTVSEPMNAVAITLKKDVPAGMVWNGSGQTGQAAGVPEKTKIRSGKPPGVQPGNVGMVTEEFVSYRLARLPAGVSTAALSVAVAAAGPGTSELRADVQVIWYPPRSAAEYVPAGMHAVTITVSYETLKQGGSTRTFTSPAVVRRLAAMLNGAHASTGPIVNCPMIWVSYRLAFASSARAAPYLTATYGGCLTVQVSAGGRAQPLLQVPAGLSTLLAGLMHVRVVPNTGVMTPASGPPGMTPAGSRAVPPPGLPDCGKPVRGVWSGPMIPAAQPAGPVSKSPCPEVTPAPR